MAPIGRLPGLVSDHKNGGTPKGTAKFGGETSRSEMAGAICRTREIGPNPIKSSSHLRAAGPIQARLRGFAALTITLLPEGDELRVGGSDFPASSGRRWWVAANPAHGSLRKRARR
jgi:hypothetical protein